MKSDKYIFFLGGYDLEMRSIKKLLEREDQRVIDKSLKLGAKLSDYKEEIDSLADGVVPVFVELTIDMELPKDAIIIDHHNEHSHKKSSIEQIASLLSVKLNRFQTLVSKNDSGYITAMVCAGATESEIKRIRMMDRRLQGATKDDDNKAKESIKEKIEKDGALIIKSATKHFSCITDEIYPAPKAIIYDETKLVFYGFCIDILKKLFAKELEEEKVYFGGGDRGFFGFKEGSLDKKEMQVAIDIVH